MLYGLNTMTGSDFYFFFFGGGGGNWHEYIYKDRPVRVKNEGSQSENYHNNQNESEYVH